MFSIPAFFWFAVVACVVLFVLPYALGPVLVKAKFRAGSRPEVTHAFAAHLPPQTNAFFMYAEALFSVCGFHPAGDVRVQRFMDRQSTDIRVFRNDRTRESGAAVCVRQQLPAGGEHMECMLSLSSEYADGRELTTSNSTDIGPDLGTPWTREVRLPGVMSVDTLLRVHRMCAADLAPGSTRTLRPAGDELAAVRDAVRRQAERYVERGLFTDAKDDGWYTLTWMGAVEFSWRQLWPVKQLLTNAARRRAERLIAAAGPRLDDERGATHAAADGDRKLSLPSMRSSQGRLDWE